MNREQAERTVKTPYYVNVEYSEDHNGDMPHTLQLVFETAARAIARATEEVLWEGTARVTVTDKRTGEVLFDEKGSFNNQ